ncbi:MAG: phosphonate metabolism protein/1,5-bisphosphokinase (PRPP-forming) PhnN [Telmatospirillum sp.]|nr:phosphonate metabolism protein/1,5-bisphosphokinase (PRPP-forming) PhnN [Telmatospirillum sp.]
MMTGKLVYIVGASGAGKDTLLSIARSRMDAFPVAFAHRYITRPADGTGETHIPLTTAEFTQRLERGLFALHWDSHGYRYGVGREIDLWLTAGLLVVVSGSRAVLTEAVRRYPGLQVVEIAASPAVLRQRLLARGRESGSDIEERLAGAAIDLSGVEGLIVIDNGGPPDIAGNRLTEVLRANLPDNGIGPR